MREFFFDGFCFLCEIRTRYQPVRGGLEMVYRVSEEQREIEIAAGENGNKITKVAYKFLGSYEAN